MNVFKIMRLIKVRKSLYTISYSSLVLQDALYQIKIKKLKKSNLEMRKPQENPILVLDPRLCCLLSVCQRVQHCLLSDLAYITLAVSGPGCQSLRSKGQV